MSMRKVIVTLATAATLMAAGEVSRAQSPVGHSADRVARAIEQVHEAVERRAAIAERILTGAKLLDESIAARKRGERERAEEALKQAEMVASEISPASQSGLLRDLARAIEVERISQNPKQAVIESPLSSNAQASLYKADRLFRPLLARYARYRDMLARILAEENIPTELLAVALVESGFNPLALSPKGARGIWQLMPATAERYGLRVHPAEDHRIDPEHSTRAAARYLRDLYRQFGDWKLALAAYNAGEARVQRIIDRTGIRDFDEMSRRAMLPLETRNYVPAVLAAWPQMKALGMSDRERESTK